MAVMIDPTPKPRVFASLLKAVVRFRVTEGDMAMLAEAAALRGLQLTSYARGVLLDDARRTVGEARQRTPK